LLPFSQCPTASWVELLQRGLLSGAR
jgi:hypothetical protein